MSNLVCYYKQDKPRLILKPVKTTRMHDNPEVLIFHDILQDEYLHELQQLATPRVGKLIINAHILCVHNE